MEEEAMQALLQGTDLYHVQSMILNTWIKHELS